MFSIEYVIAQGRRSPAVVYRADTTAFSLGAAQQVAQGTLEVVRRMFPQTPPDNFQILDDNDEVVLRSWEPAPPPHAAFGLVGLPEV